MKHPLLLHLALLAALIVVAIVTVILLVWGNSDGDTKPRGGASTNRSPSAPRTTTAASPPLVRDPKYRFVGEPLVLFRPPGPGRPSARYRVMVRVRPRLPQRSNPEARHRSSMFLDGVQNTSFGACP